MRSFFVALLSAGVAFAQGWTQPVGSPSGNPIFTPSLNERVPVGSPYTITWNPTTEGTVTILLLRGPSENVVPLYAIASSIANSGSFTWTPSSSLEDDTSRYGLQIIVDATGQYQWSTQFGIANTGSQVSSSSVVVVASSSAEPSVSAVSVASSSVVPVVSSSSVPVVSSSSVPVVSSVPASSSAVVSSSRVVPVSTVSASEYSSLSVVYPSSSIVPVASVRPSTSFVVVIPSSTAHVPVPSATGPLLSNDASSHFAVKAAIPAILGAMGLAALL